MSRKISRTVIILLCISVVAVSYFYTAGKKRVEIDSGNRLVMGTFARVVAVAEDSGTAEKCIQAAFEEINKVDDLMSHYKSDSEISRVNRDGAKRPVQVSESTYEVLQRSVEFSRLSEGAFDVTVGPLVDLFRSAEKKQVAPGKEEIDRTRSKVGFEKLKLDDNNRTVQFAVDGMRLDLGGIAKGYAIDKAIEAIRRYDVMGAMVDIGGDIRCYGVPPKEKDNWLIGLQDPNSTIQGFGGGELFLKLKLADGAVTTSGDYQQFILIEGKRHSHIINRKTGTSVEGLSSVTIIADNATDADALATAVSVMGAEKGLVLIEKIPQTEAILITSQPKTELIKTSGAGKYVKVESQE
ncbi:MAG: FAD:protein FMN transferase [Planctomycetota bacterium]|jgi:thiamine biosynthesis lipoprotein